MIIDKRAKDLQNKISVIIFISIFFIIGRNITLSVNTMDTNIFESTIVLFTGMQINKVTLFSVGVTPILMTEGVIRAMRSKILPDVKNFIENPLNQNKVKYLKMGLFILYTILQIILIYNNIDLFKMIILFIGTVFLKYMCDSVSKTKIVNGTSLYILISIVFDIFMALTSNFFYGLSLLIIFTIISIAFYQIKSKLIIKDDSNKTNYILNIKTEYISISPLFYSSMISGIAIWIMEWLKINTKIGEFLLIDIIGIFIYIVCIFFFSYVSLKDLISPKKYLNKINLAGYHVDKAKDDLGYKILQKKIVKITFISGIILSIMTYSNVIMKACGLTPLLSVISIALAINIISNLIKNINNYNINNNYELPI